MNFYPLVRVILSTTFFLVSLVILINPEPLVAISPYAVEGRHLLIAITGTLLYIGDHCVSMLSERNGEPCLCTCTC